MTNEQFERVFSKAQEIQTKRYTQKELKAAENALNGFEVAGSNKKASTEQAAYILNVMCMDITGEYTPSVLVQVRECYLNNVTIVRGKKNAPKKKKK